MRDPHLRNKYRTEYLWEPSWQFRAAEMRDLAGGRCEFCGSKNELDVHHIHYRSLGAEQPTDLVVLCRDCHRGTHRGREPHRSVLRKLASTHPGTFDAIFAARERYDFWQAEDDYERDGR